MLLNQAWSNLLSVSSVLEHRTPMPDGTTDVAIANMPETAKYAQVYLKKGLPRHHVLPVPFQSCHARHNPLASYDMTRCKAIAVTDPHWQRLNGQPLARYLVSLQDIWQKAGFNNLAIKIRIDPMTLERVISQLPVEMHCALHSHLGESN